MRGRLGRTAGKTVRVKTRVCVCVCVCASFINGAYAQKMAYASFYAMFAIYNKLDRKMCGPPRKL